MPGPFDSATKRLLREKPEHYVTWLVAQATFVRQLPTELKRRRFSMLDDILEESWTYQEILRKGMQKGLEQGLEQGREEEHQRRIQEQRETVVNLVQMRFPELVPLAEQNLHFIHDADALHNLVLKLFAVRTVGEARQVITETDKD